MSLESIVHIFLMRNVLQIGQPVIRWVSVFVVYLFSFGTWSNEGPKNQLMEKTADSLSFLFGKCPPLVSKMFSASFSRGTYSGSRSRFVPPDSSQVGHRVPTLPTDDGFPDLCHLGFPVSVCHPMSRSNRICVALPLADEPRGGRS